MEKEGLRSKIQIVPHSVYTITKFKVLVLYLWQPFYAIIKPTWKHSHTQAIPAPHLRKLHRRPSGFFLPGRPGPHRRHRLRRPAGLPGSAG